MKSTVEQLTGKQRLALAHFYGTEAYEALVRLAEIEINGLAKDALAALDMNQVLYFRGKATWAKELPLLIRQLNKGLVKKS